MSFLGQFGPIFRVFYDVSFRECTNSSKLKTSISSIFPLRDQLRTEVLWFLKVVESYIVVVSNMFYFHKKMGEDELILTSIFFNWVAQPPTRLP